MVCISSSEHQCHVCKARGAQARIDLREFLLACALIPNLCSIRVGPHTHLCEAHNPTPTMEALSPYDEMTAAGATLEQGVMTTDDANAREIDELWRLLADKDADLRHAAELGESPHTSKIKTRLHIKCEVHGTSWYMDGWCWDGWCWNQALLLLL